jgi:anti-anti-sigma factor
MEISKTREGNTVVMTVKGRMDAVSSPEFENEMEELIGQGEKAFIVDLSDLDYISSAGLRSILKTAKKLKAREGKLLLSSLKDVVKEVFEISGFSSIIPIYDSVESAFAEL